VKWKLIPGVYGGFSLVAVYSKETIRFYDHYPTLEEINAALATYHREIRDDHDLGGEG
jgi:hypothetical protein